MLRHNRSLTQRRLRVECLESREMLAGHSIDPTPLTPTAELLTSAVAEVSVTASTNQGVAQSDLIDNAARAINQFAVDLYTKLVEEDGNQFVSPFTISTALAMTFAGARGATAEEMSNVLHFDALDEDVHRAFSSLIDDLNNAADGGVFDLDTANALWGQDPTQLPPDKFFRYEQEFLNLLDETYGAEFQQVDFWEEQAREDARQQINRWVEEQTNQKIKEILAPGILDEWTRLVLANAIYFKGNWATKFDEDRTRAAPFTKPNGETQTVAMMQRTGTYRYTEANGYQIVELPYEGDRLSMIVLLPRSHDEGSTATLDQRSNLVQTNAGQAPDHATGFLLTAEQLETALSQLRRRKISLHLPRFKAESSYELSKTLEEMGMPRAFGSADFSGITEDIPLQMSNVIHKAFVEVNERGTEAAAATVVVIAKAIGSALPARPIVFRADHPFHFLIRDTTSGATLFMGRITEPSESEDQFNTENKPFPPPALTADPAHVIRVEREDGATGTTIYLPGGNGSSYTAKAVSDPSELAYLLKEDLGLWFTGKDHLNWGNQKEKWLRGKGEDEWFFVKPNGVLYGWDRAHGKNLDLSRAVANLDETFYQDLAKLYDATQPITVDPTSLESVAFDLDRDHGLRFHESYYRNWSGKFNEKWVRGSDQWYFITPDGGLYRWNTMDGKSLDMNKLVAQLDPTFHASPARLHDAKTPRTTLQIANELHQKLTFGLTERDFRNWGGWDERWLQSSDGWYFVTPRGHLYRWRGGRDLSTSTFVATLNETFHEHLELLVNNHRPQAKVKLIGSTVQIESPSGFKNDLWVYVTATHSELKVHSAFKLARK